MNVGSKVRKRRNNKTITTIRSIIVIIPRRQLTRRKIKRTRRFVPLPRACFGNCHPERWPQQMDHWSHQTDCARHLNFSNSWHSNAIAIVWSNFRSWWMINTIVTRTYICMYRCINILLVPCLKMMDSTTTTIKSPVTPRPFQTLSGGPLFQLVLSVCRDRFELHN